MAVGLFLALLLLVVMVPFSSKSKTWLLNLNQKMTRGRWEERCKGEGGMGMGGGEKRRAGECVCLWSLVEHVPSGLFLLCKWEGWCILMGAVSHPCGWKSLDSSGLV